MHKRKKLIFWRIEKGLKQVDVARKLGISNGYYSNLENGRATPSYSLLMKFKDTFEINYIMELFKLDEGDDTYGNGNTSRDIDEKQILD